jgi:hypothetical protein
MSPKSNIIPFFPKNPEQVLEYVLSDHENETKTENNDTSILNIKECNKDIGPNGELLLGMAIGAGITCILCKL